MQSSPSIEDFNALTNEVSCLNKENKLLNTLIDIYNKKAEKDISAIYTHISMLKQTINISNGAAAEFDKYIDNIKQYVKDNKKSCTKHIDAVELRMIDDMDEIRKSISEIKKQNIDISNQLMIINKNYKNLIDDISKLIEAAAEEQEIHDIPATQPVIRKSTWNTLLCRGNNTA